MGRKKTTKKSASAKRAAETRAKNKVKKTIMQDFLGGITVALGIILLVLLTFDGMGNIVKSVKSVLNGLFGYAMYVIPCSLIIIGIYVIAAEKKANITKQLYKALFTTIMISAVIGVFTMTKFNIFDKFIQFCIDECYTFFKQKKKRNLFRNFSSEWALRDSNPRPSGCKPDALNQLS